MSEEKQQHEDTAVTAESFENDPQSDEQLDDQTLPEILAEDQLIEDEFLSPGPSSSGDEPSSGDEDAPERIRIIASDETVARPSEELAEELAPEPSPGSLNGTPADS